MKKYFLILFFIYLSVFGGDYFIKGVVRCKSDNSPLYLANILLENGKGTTTDINGNFNLSLSEIKNKSITITYVGYNPVTIALEDITNDFIQVFLEKKYLTSQTVLIDGLSLIKKERMFTYSTLTKESLQENYSFQDVPEMISYLPSTMFYSEGGNGIGYNYVSIRGFDQRRIAVSVNGVPQNDPEDHNVYWLDMPDLIANSELIQIQRGSGSGINGYPSIGGAINIITSNFADKSSANISAGLGSYNTRKYSIAVGSGLVDKNYSYYFSLSNLLTSGYRNQSWADFKSFYLSAVRFDDDLTSQINVYGGIVKDGLAYTGLPKFAISDLSLRRLNHSYWSASNNEFTYELLRRPEEKEEFFQPHFEILNDYEVTKNITINSALFLVLGEGYFDYDASWADTSYLRLTSNNGFNVKSNPGNVLVRAMVENKQFGWIPRANIKHSKGELVFGAELRYHNSIHWGSILFGENLPTGITPEFKYYYYRGSKNILNFFVNETYNIDPELKIFGEIQVAYNKTRLFDEKYNFNDFSINNLFFNPKIGLNYKFNENLNVYFSIAHVSREPRLKNYYDAAESSGGKSPQFELNTNGTYNFDKPLVKPEKMISCDVGLLWNNDITNFSANVYFMSFEDEIVSSGQLDRFGQPITGNMDKTIHYGFEFSGVVKPVSNLELIGNFTISKNYIKTGYTYFEENDSIVKLDLSNNKLGGFPDVMFNTIIKYSLNNFSIQLMGKYIGKFYSDNYDDNLKDYLQKYPNITDYEENTVDPYFVANLLLSYDLNLESLLKNIKFTVQINNIFNKLYASYAQGQEYFPGAERNYYFSARVEL